MLEDYSNLDNIVCIDEDTLNDKVDVSKSEKTSVNLFVNDNNDIVISLDIGEDILKKITQKSINVEFTLSKDFIQKIIKQ